MYEKKSQPLAPPAVFYKRIAAHIAVAGLLLGACLSLGIVGYHATTDMPWIDALHNASMILSGMGPVVEIKTVSGKLFSSFYALFSGVAFITNIGIILAPAAHRLFHRLHVDDDE
jgi:hypothetical protein